MRTCRNGHQIVGSNDRYSNGNCKRCANEAVKRYRAKANETYRNQSAAQIVYAAFKDAGLSPEPGDPPTLAGIPITDLVQTVVAGQQKDYQ